MRFPELTREQMTEAQKKGTTGSSAARAAAPEAPSTCSSGARS
jgi:hypothetical protein